MVAQGWYEDPFQLHEARWFSAGKATSLVRDGSTESQDEPPSETYVGSLVPVADQAASDGQDLLRADGRGGSLSNRDMINAALDQAGSLGIGFS
jgi:hypothetical protein